MCKSGYGCCTGSFGPFSRSDLWSTDVHRHQRPGSEGFTYIKRNSRIYFCQEHFQRTQCSNSRVALIDPKSLKPVFISNFRFVGKDYVRVPLENADHHRHPCGGVHCDRTLSAHQYIILVLIRLNLLADQNLIHRTDTLPSIQNSAAWTAVRQAKNWQDNGFVGDVKSNDIRCNQLYVRIFCEE